MCACVFFRVSLAVCFYPEVCECRLTVEELFKRQPLIPFFIALVTCVKQCNHRANSSTVNHQMETGSSSQKASIYF